MLDYSQNHNYQQYGHLSTSLVMPEQPVSPKHLKKTNKHILAGDRQNSKKLTQSYQQDEQNSEHLQNSMISRNKDGNRESPSLKPSVKSKQNKKIVLETGSNNEVLLGPILQQSEYSLRRKGMYPQDVEQRRNQRQHKVYDISAGKQPKIVLQHMYNNLNHNNKQLNKEIEQVINGVNSKNYQKIRNKNPNGNQNQNLKRKIPKNKEQLRQLEQIDKYRLLKIKNGQIKNKVSSLREQLQDQYYRDKAATKNMLPEHDNIKESDYYSLENPKTKQAQQFIANLRKKKQQQSIYFKQHQQYQKQLEQDRKNQQELERLQSIQQKKHLRLIDFAEKQAQRKMQQQQDKKKVLQYQHFSKNLSEIYQQNNPTPLYMRKQQQFIQDKIIPEIYERHKILNRISKEKQLDFQDIDEHDQWYMEQKYDSQMKQQLKKQIKGNQLEQLQHEQGKYYKGRYRYFALEDMVHNQMMGNKQKNQRKRDIDQVKRARQLLYSDNIRELQKEHASKTLEPQKQFKKRVRNINGTISQAQEESTDPNVSHRSADQRADGKRNLHYLHNLVQQKGIKKDKPMIRLIQQRGVYPDYMEQIREKRNTLNISKITKVNSRLRRNQYQHNQSENSEENHSQDKSKKVSKDDSNNIKKLKAISESMDERMKRNYIKKKNNAYNIDFDDDRRMEDEDIQAVKAKLTLMNRID